MNKFRKVPLEVKVGDSFVCTRKSEYFTEEWVYKVQSCNYDIGSGYTEVEFLDDDYDLHIVTEKFLTINFKKQ